MSLYHCLLKEVLDYVEDTGTKKMSDEELFEVLICVKNLHSSLTETVDQHIVGHLISAILKEGRKRNGLLFCNFSSNGEVRFASKSVREFIEGLPRSTRKSFVDGALNKANNTGFKFENGAQGKIRNYLLSM